MVGEHGLIKGFPDNWMHFNVSSPSVRVDDVVPPDVPVCMLKADVEGTSPRSADGGAAAQQRPRPRGAARGDDVARPARRVGDGGGVGAPGDLGFTVRQLPRRMDNNGSATLIRFPPSRARALSRAAKSRSPLAGTPLAETPFGRAYHCDINTFSTNLSRGTGSTTGATGVVLGSNYYRFYGRRHGLLDGEPTPRSRLMLGEHPSRMTTARSRMLAAALGSIQLLGGWSSGLDEIIGGMR